MSSSINSLKKVKKAPLFLPEMAKKTSTSSTPSPSISAYDNVDTSLSKNGEQKDRYSPLYDFNAGYVKSSQNMMTNNTATNRLTSSFSKHPLLRYWFIYR
jgi:hypothetical protein